MKFCPKCNKEYEDRFTFCYDCGSKLEHVKKEEQKFCPYCGKAIDADSNFCPFCSNCLKENVRKHNVEKQSFADRASNYESINGNEVSLFKRNPFVKWGSVVFLYLLGLLTWLVMYHFARIYRIGAISGRSVLSDGSKPFPLGETILIDLVCAVLLVVMYYAIKQLNGTASKLFFYIVIYGAVANVFGAFGGPFGAIVAILCLWAIQKYSNDEKLGR